MKAMTPQQTDERMGVNVFPGTYHAQNIITVVEVKVCTVMSKLTVNTLQQHDGMIRVCDVCTEYFDHKHGKPTGIPLILQGVNTSF